MLLCCKLTDARCRQTSFVKSHHLKIQEEAAHTDVHIKTRVEKQRSKAAAPHSLVQNIHTLKLPLNSYFLFSSMAYCLYFLYCRINLLIYCVKNALNCVKKIILPRSNSIFLCVSIYYFMAAEVQVDIKTNGVVRILYKWRL